MVLDAHEQIEKYQEFISVNYEKQLHDAISTGRRSLEIDFAELSKYDPELAENLLNEPEESLKAGEIALEQFDISTKLRFRVFNLPKTQEFAIRDIRSNEIEKFVVIQGIVRQASDVRPQVVSAKFECPSCGNNITILQIDQKFKEPTRCSCGRRGKFRLLSKELVDAQRLVIEEAPDILEGGTQPKRLSVFLREDLVEPKMEKKTTPGARVFVNGVIKEVVLPLRTGGTSTKYDLVMEANYIEPAEETFEEMVVDPKTEEEIKKLSKDPKIYERLVRSIAPSIWGHDRIKEAVLLQLMGGVRKIKSDGTTVRGDMHVLLIGDPGSGKSATLQFISKIAPKGRFVSGKGASGAGLTAAVVRDEFLRGWALEAGAMVLANKGVCIIDELDKMSEDDRNALHEALEQQTISISKANIQATLRAETTVLAAANPKMGRFDPYTPIPAQIDLPSTLINRFDLIFPIRDIPDKRRDEKIAKHVLSAHMNPEEVEGEIPVKLMKKYISYARQKIKPKLTEGAVEEIQNYYVTLRNASTQASGDREIKSIPISARQLEALVRMSEGSAKVRLSKKVTKLDAKRAISLLNYCLMQVGFDPETGQIDIDRITTGVTAAVRNKIVVIKDIIKMFEARGKKMIAMDDLVAEAIEKGIEEDKVNEIIEKMKRVGDVFSPRQGFIQRI